MGTLYLILTSSKNIQLCKKITHLNLIAVIVSVYCLGVKSDKFKFKQACEQHRECLSRKCIPLCDDSSKKLCIQPSWFYERHGLEFPQCIEKDIDHSHLYNYRKVGESCHNDVGCNSKHCLKECSSKRMKCAESKLFYEKKKMDAPKCIDQKAMQMNEKPGVSSDAKMEKNDAIMKDKNKDSSATTVEERTDVEKPKVSPSASAEENSNETKGRTDASLDKKVEENIFGIKDQLKDPDKRHLGQTCKVHDDCMTGNCVPLCDSSNPNSYCIQPRWSFEMHDLDIPSCLEKEKFQRLEALMIIKDGSDASKTDFAADDSDENLRGLRRMKEKNKVATSKQDSNPDTFDYKSLIKKKLNENRETNTVKDLQLDEWKSKIDGNI